MLWRREEYRHHNYNRQSFTRPHTGPEEHRPCRLFLFGHVVRFDNHAHTGSSSVRAKTITRTLFPIITEEHRFAVIEIRRNWLSTWFHGLITVIQSITTFRPVKSHTFGVSLTLWGPSHALTPSRRRLQISRTRQQSLVFQQLLLHFSFILH